MSTYTPELGQAIFGQPHQQYEVPAIMEAVLDAISQEYGIAYWNAKQAECPSPFGNNGTRLETPTFKVHAYDWGDEEQPWNFAWRDLRISWYKWCGRGMSANMQVTPDVANECLEECLAEIRKMHRESEDWSHYPDFIDLT